MSCTVPERRAMAPLESVPRRSPMYRVAPAEATAVFKCPPEDCVTMPSEVCAAGRGAPASMRVIANAKVRRTMMVRNLRGKLKFQLRKEKCGVHWYCAQRTVGGFRTRVGATCTDGPAGRWDRWSGGIRASTVRTYGAGCG